MTHADEKLSETDGSRHCTAAALNQLVPQNYNEEMMSSDALQNFVKL